MSFKFEHINDYDVIIPPDKQGAGNDFKALIDKLFPYQDKNLIFCLIEIVTLTDAKDAFGEIYLFSDHSKEEGKKIIAEYKQIVQKVKNEKKYIKIQETLQWYRKNSYILLKQNNDVEFQFPNPPPDWEQDPGTQEELKPDYPKPKNGDLSESQIQEYLQFYADILHQKFGFKDYPYYCIIVRPISAIEGKDTIPLGNLYLHFATVQKEEDKEFYPRLISELLLVWFKKKGVKIIQEIMRKDNDGSKKKPHNDHIPIMPYKEKTDKSIRIRALLDKVYNKSELLENLNNRHKFIKENFIPIFLKHRAIVKDDNAEEDLSEYWDNRGRLGFNDKYKTISEEDFIYTIVRRQIALVMILLFRYNPKNVHFYLVYEDNGLDNKTEGSIRGWFRANLYMGKVERDDFQKKVYNCISRKEKDFLNQCKDLIKVRLDQLKKQDNSPLYSKFNALCYQEFKVEEDE